MAKKIKVPNGGGGGTLLPAGVPMGDDGAPLVEADITPEVMAAIGAADLESARVVKQSQEILRRKGAGETNVKWSTDPAIAYHQCLQVWKSGLWVSVEQISPHKDDNIEDRPAEAVPTYGALKAYIRDVHWKGGQARYKWRCWDAGQPQRAVGLIDFQPDPIWVSHREDGGGGGFDMARQSPPPQQHGPPPQYGAPQQQQAPYGSGGGGYPPQYVPQQYVQQWTQPVQQWQPQPVQQWQPNQYGPPPQQYVPQPQQQQAPLQQQAAPPQQPPVQYIVQQPAAAPPTAVLPDGVTAMLMHQLQQLSQDNATMREAMRTQQLQPPTPPPQQINPEWIAYQAAQAAQAAVAAAAPPPGPPAPPPKDPVTVMSEGADTFRKMMNVAKSFISDVAPPRVEPTAPEAPDVDDDFPLAVKEVGPIRMVADKATGKLVDSFTALAFNSDKVAKVGENIFEKAMKLIEKREEIIDKGERMRQSKLADAERLTQTTERYVKAAREMKELQQPQQSSQQTQSSQPQQQSAPPAPPPTFIAQPEMVQPMVSPTPSWPQPPWPTMAAPGQPVPTPMVVGVAAPPPTPPTPPTPTPPPMTVGVAAPTPPVVMPLPVAMSPELLVLPTEPAPPPEMPTVVPVPIPSLPLGAEPA